VLANKSKSHYKTSHLHYPIENLDVSQYTKSSCEKGAREQENFQHEAHAGVSWQVSEKFWQTDCCSSDKPFSTLKPSRCTIKPSRGHEPIVDGALHQEMKHAV